MQDQGGPNPDNGQALDRVTYDSLAAALGAGPVGGIAQRFRADLAQRFADPSARDGLRRDAHAVISSAGMLGFRKLSTAARVLERACEAGEELAEPLAALLAARVAADRCLRELAIGVD